MTTSWTTLEHNRSIVIDAAAQAGIALRKHTAHEQTRSFCIAPRDEQAWLNAVRDIRSDLEPVVIDRHEAPTGSTPPAQVFYSVYTPVCSPNGKGVMAEEYAAEVHLVDDTGALVSMIGTVDTEPPFPIDVVYTWVDGTDLEWFRRMMRHRSGERAAVDGTSDERFGSGDELRYSMRSMAQHAPWVSNIFLVTDHQVPAWLSDLERVTVVDHRDIFSNAAVLPVFNSHAIESQLHHISGLSEHYLYINDDVFFGAMAQWSDFFDPDGTALYSLSAATVPEKPSANSPGVDHSGRNALDLLSARFGHVAPNKVQHIVHSQRRSLAEQLEHEFHQTHTTTAASRFRSPDDVSFAAFLHHRYGEFVGLTRSVAYDYDYIDAGRNDLGAVLDRLTIRPPLIWCVNDNALPRGRRRRVNAEIRRALETLYPYPAAWEVAEPATTSRPSGTHPR